MTYIASGHAGDSDCAGQAGLGHGSAERGRTGEKVWIRRGLLRGHLDVVAKAQAKNMVPFR